MRAPGEEPTLVLITAPFRAGSTAHWDALRAEGDTIAFYEPLHEALWEESDRRLPDDPTHPVSPSAYFENYPSRSELAPWRSVREVAFSHSLTEQQTLVLRRYVALLASNRRTNDTVVFQFNRTCLLQRELRATFPKAVLVYLDRPPGEIAGSIRGTKRSAFALYYFNYWLGLQGFAPLRSTRVARVVARTVVRLWPPALYSWVEATRSRALRDAEDVADLVVTQQQVRDSPSEVLARIRTLARHAAGMTVSGPTADGRQADSSGPTRSA